MARRARPSAETPLPPDRSERRLASLLAAALAVITAAVYARTLRFDQIIIDDGPYVFENPVVRRGLTAGGFRWAFGAHQSNWHPLTWLSHMADVSMFGLNAPLHHLQSIVFHCLTAALLLIALHRLTRRLWPSAFVAALFALHPLHVESVAWIAERKDVLSGFFFVCSLLAYERFVRRKSRGSYGWLLLFAALGLMAKPMLVTLPCVLLLLDWWPLERTSATSVWRLVVEKVPLFALSAADSVATWIAQRGESVVPLARVPFSIRIENALTSYVSYLLDTVWPSSLAVLYPYPATISANAWAVALIVLDLLMAAAWFLRRRSPYFLCGWLWYLGMLVPVIGLVQVGLQSRADRYTYLPLIGIFIAVAFGAADVASRFRVPRTAVAAMAALLLGGCAAVTLHQLTFWRDGETMFRHTAESGYDSATTEMGIAASLVRKHRLADSVIYFERAIAMQPDDANAYVILGTVLTQLGRGDEAIALWTEGVRRVPDSPAIHVNLGAALGQAGDEKRAREEFERAVALDPTFAPALMNLGRMAAHRGDRAAARSYFERVLAADPFNGRARRELAALAGR